MKKLIIPIVLAMAMLLSSCGVAIEDEAAFLAEVSGLITASDEVNRIFFGEGLPFTDPDGLTADEIVARSDDVLGVKVIYRPVAEDAPYKSKDDVMTLCRSVYSADYSDYLQKLGFDGVTDDNDSVIQYARYIEDYEAGLTVNVKAVTDAIPLVRTYDLATLAIGRTGRNYVVVSVDAYDDGKFAEKKELKVVREPDGWRLDWPTY